jgi:hypothetical protein
VSKAGDPRQVATLWQLYLKNDRLACVVYREDAGLQLSVESPTAVIVCEPFDLQPRALARAKALRTSLLRRGWNDTPAVANPEP